MTAVVPWLRSTSEMRFTVDDLEMRSNSEMKCALLDPNQLYRISQEILKITVPKLTTLGSRILSFDVLISDMRK